jgi:hypothetical protein
MESCYLTTLPKEVVRALAGFNVAGGQFLLPRAECEVPEELARSVFPAIEGVQSQLDEGQVHDIAGQGFLRLLIYLREVILQDSVLLRREYPDHPLWNHELFKTPCYGTFARALESRLQTGVGDEMQSSVQAALPLLSSIVETGFASMGLRLAAIESAVHNVRSDVAQDLAKGKFTVAFVPSDSEHTSVTPKAAANDLPGYRLSRALRTVSDVWMEYDQGWQGGPAVRDLDSKFGTSWRSSEAERKYYSRRRVFYEAIQFLAAEKGAPPMAVADIIDARRQQKKLTLDAFMKDVKSYGPGRFSDIHTVY